MLVVVVAVAHTLLFAIAWWGARARWCSKKKVSALASRDCDCDWRLAFVLY
jgi:hypothetical protein